jgi:vitamin B12 transporter
MIAAANGCTGSRFKAGAAPATVCERESPIATAALPREGGEFESLASPETGPFARTRNLGIDTGRLRGRWRLDRRTPSTMKRLPIAGLLGLACLGAHAQAPQLLLAGNLESVVVTATRTLGGDITTLRDTVVITGEELRAEGPRSLAEVLQKHAGVEVRSTGGPGQPTGIFLRGAGAAQTLVLIDGLRVGSATAGTTALESIPLEMIERIEVVKGALSSLYGSEAIGGVVQIFTRGKSVPHLFASAAYGSDNDRRASAGLATADETTRASLSVGARKVDAPSATNPRVPFGVHDPDRDPHENAFATLRLSQRLWQGETLALESFGTRSRTFFDGGSPEDRSEQKVLGARITSSTQMQPGWASHLAVGHGRDQLVFHGPFPARFETRQDQASWINDLATPAGSLLAGIELVRQRVLPQSGAAGDPVYVRDRRDTRSAFVSWNETWRGQRVEASIRRDDDDQFGTRNTGAMSMAGQPTAGGTRVVVTVARGFRAPTFNDLYLTFPGYTPNPELRPERSRNREISLRGAVGPVSQWRLTGFDNRLEDLIVFSPAAGTVLNLARARVRGLEARFDAHWLTMDWRGNFTLQRPRNEQSGARLQNRALRFGALEASRSWRSWAAALSLVGSGARFDSIDEAPASRLPAYVRVDARLAYDISKMWKAELHAVNLGDRRYETALGYDAPRRGVMLNVRFAAF